MTLQPYCAMIKEFHKYKKPENKRFGLFYNFNT